MFYFMQSAEYEIFQKLSLFEAILQPFLAKTEDFNQYEIQFETVCKCTCLETARNNSYQISQIKMYSCKTISCRNRNNHFKVFNISSYLRNFSAKSNLP